MSMKSFNNDEILYIVEKVLKEAIQRYHFKNQYLKPYHRKNPKTLELTLKFGMSIKNFK